MAPVPPILALPTPPPTDESLSPRQLGVTQPEVEPGEDPSARPAAPPPPKEDPGAEAGPSRGSFPEKSPTHWTTDRQLSGRHIYRTLVKARSGGRGLLLRPAARGAARL